MISHTEDDLGMALLVGDPSLYMKKTAEILEGLLRTYIVYLMGMNSIKT